MGVYDRDYYQDRPSASGFNVRSIASILVGINALVWVSQVILMHSAFQPAEHLACPPDRLLGGFEVWRPFTAAFVHDPRTIGPILCNLFFLYFFARELEWTHGRGRVLSLYLTAGAAAILVEAMLAYFVSRQPQTPILGAHGAVMGMLVFYIVLFPKREIPLIGVYAAPAWLLCALYGVWDLYHSTQRPPGEGTEMAFFAHLSGGAVGLLHRVLLSPWDTIRERAAHALRRIRRRPAPIVKPILRMERPNPGPSPGPAREERRAGDPISRRIDEILEKISRSGRDSLTPEELEFLQRNSRRYRSER